jgi:hypothetical protein
VNIKENEKKGQKPMENNKHSRSPLAIPNIAVLLWEQEAGWTTGTPIS